MPSPSLPRHSPTTFPWEDCEEICEETLAEARALGLTVTCSEDRRAFILGESRIEPPLVFPIGPLCTSLDHFVENLPVEPGLHVVLLMQAGASSLAVFEGGEVLRTKTFKRYVVRGSGRAQPTHLNAKGKSRYGSRLRLQNARAILEETNEKLHDWWSEFGTPETVFYNAPVRLWADLRSAKPVPPFTESLSLVRIPLDLPKPTTDVLVRAYRSLCYGRISTIDAS